MEQVKFLKNKYMKDKKLVEILKKTGWTGSDNPHIDEVIDACDDKIKEIIMFADKTWGVYPWYPKDIGGKVLIEAKTPEEAVVKFYKALKANPKKKKVIKKK